jgi:molybdopterin/thiamine biosynthesis adenylyltransferase/molybdopterin synthase catalytic subunit
MFSLSTQPLHRDELHQALANKSSGAIVVFEGWVRNHNEGKEVQSLEYQVYRELALKEGERILQEAKDKFNLHHVMSVHREGHLKLGDIAIWIGATASHRDDAFKATRYVIDEIKLRLPVWKKEHYSAHESNWVFCRHHHHHVHFEEANYYQKQSRLIKQAKLKNARVLVVGAGGLGCPVLVNLATAGVGFLRVVDPDSISLSNIHRQFLYSPHLVGEKKVAVAKSRLLDLNPFIQVDSIISFFKADHLHQIDLVLDCTDNMKTKYLIHDACLEHQIPLISAGLFKYEGQLRTIIPGKGCLRCFVTQTPDDHLLGNCNDFGVLGASTSVLGSLQASEAIEFLQLGTNSSSETTIYLNLKSLHLMKLKNSRREDCLYCQGRMKTTQDLLEVENFENAELLDIRNLSDHDIMNLAPAAHKRVLCCHRGVRSLKVVEELRARGHENVFSLKGGASTLS